MRYALQLVIATLAGAPLAAQDDPSDAVVKIFSNQRYPDFVSPWIKQSPAESTGSGVVIEGERILTNAHVVQWASRIEVQPNQSSKKYAAEVVGIDPMIDLAVLAIRKKSEEFFADRPSLAMDPELPQLMKAVNVYGYPMGGTDLSITEGIISRIEYTAYDFDRLGLIVQIDAALNPGNSGGPAIVDGKLVGLAMSSLTVGNDIGFLVPVDEIRSFLDDVSDGVHVGSPQLFDHFQTLENDALRERLGVGDDVTGLVVTQPASNDPGYPLRPMDVVTHIGAEDIQDDGKIFFRDDLRLAFQVMVPRLAENGTVPLTVFRGGESFEVRVPVLVERDLVVRFLGDGYPSYFIIGPLAFTTLHREFAGSLVQGYADQLLFEESPIIQRLTDPARFAGESLVVALPTLFDHPLTRGYSAPNLWIVDAVDGQAVENLPHLVRLLRDASGEFLELRFHGRGQETLVFNREELEDATEEILNDNSIRHRYSDDLKPVWESAAEDG